MSFEGGYHHAEGGLSPLAVLECKICWWGYDPATGDETRQIDPGTPFTALPDDWSCPNCGAEPTQFLVKSDPGAPALMVEAMLRTRAKALTDDFTEIWNAKMRDVPMVNPTLHVEAVGFRLHEGRPLGVLLSPWFMNLVLLPSDDEDWSDLVPGRKEVIAFPSGEYEFTQNVREMTGGYKACALFSMMGEFRSQQAARDVAEAVMAALFDPENRAETDRTADIRAAREAAFAPQPELDTAPTRRAVLTGGLAAEDQA